MMLFRKLDSNAPRDSRRNSTGAGGTSPASVLPRIRSIRGIRRYPIACVWLQPRKSRCQRAPFRSTHSTIKNSSKSLKIKASSPARSTQIRHPFRAQFPSKKSAASGGAEVAGQFADRFEQQVGSGGADAVGRRKRTKHSDRADSGTASHLDIFRRVAYIHALVRLRAEAPQSQMQRRRMRLFARRVLAENERGENLAESERIDLLANTVAAPAGNKPEPESSRQALNHLPGAGKQFRTLAAICGAPKPVGFSPLFPRNPRRAIDLIPVRTIVAPEFGFAPIDFERAKHGDVSASVGGVRIEQSAIPIEQDDPGIKFWRFHVRTIHDRRIVADVVSDSCLARDEAHGDHIVAAQGEIVEAGCVATPSLDIAILGADDMSGGVHLHGAEPSGPLDQRNLELDGCAWRHIARSEEIDAAGADVASDESDGNRLGIAVDARQTQRQSQRSPRVAAALRGYTNGVRWDARKFSRSRFSRVRYCGFRAVFEFGFMQRRRCSLLPSPIWCSSHGTSPQPSPSLIPARTGFPNMNFRLWMVKVETA